MRRQSCTSSSRTLLSQLILPAALAMSISSAPVTLLAQKKDDTKKSKTVQVETTARQKAEDYLKQSRKELKKDNFAIARDYLEKAKSADAKTPGLSKMAKDIVEAEKSYKLDQQQDQIDAIIKSAKKSLKDGKYDQANAQAKKVLDLDPKNKKAKALLSDVQAEKQQAAEDVLEASVEKQISAAEKALKENKFEQARRSHAAAVEAAKGLFKEDLAELLKDINEAESEEKIANNQEQIDKLIKTAETQLDANQFTPARQTVNQILQIDKNNDDAKDLLAEIGKEEKDFEANRADREVQSELDAAERLLDAEKYEAAIAAYQAILAKNSKNEEAIDGLADAKHGLAEAKEEELAGKLDAIIERGEKALDKGDLAGASKALAEAKVLAPKDKDVADLEEEIQERTSDIKAEAVEKELNGIIAKGNAAIAKKDVPAANAALTSAKAVAPKDKKVKALQEDIDDLVADLKEAEADKIAEAKKIEAKKIAAAKKAADAKKAEEAKKAAEAKELADAKKAEEASKAKKAAEAKKKADAKKAQEARKAADAKKKADAKKAADAKRAADAKKKAEAKKVADAKTTTSKTAPKTTSTTKTTTSNNTTVKPVVTRSATEKKAEEKQSTEVAQASKKADSSKAKADAKKKADKEAAAKKAREADAKKKADKLAADKKAREAEAKKKADKLAADKKAREVEAKKKADAKKAEEAKKAAAAKAKADKEAAELEAKRKADAEKKAAEDKRLAEQQKKEAEEKAAAEKRQREKEAQDRSEALVTEGIDQYDAGKLEEARQSWTRALTLAPNMEKAKAYLENTEQEYNDLLAQRQARVNFQQSEKDAQDKMNTLIPFRTMAPNSLSDFLGTLRLLSGIDFVIVGEVNAKVEVAFEDEPLHKVLDSVLLPMGLKWRREPGSDTVIIEPDLRTEVFAVSPNQLTTIDALIEEGVVGRLLYGPTGEPVIQGQEVFTDSRQNILVLTDSEQNINKIRRTLDSLKNEGVVPGLVIDTFEIEEEKAPEVKALLSAILSADDDMPYNPERKLILEGSTLIIKDTSENIQRVREILQDEGFMSRFIRDELSVSTFNLTPVLEFEDNPDLVQSFTDNVRQVVETLLYAKDGRTKAEREGRRLWYDPATKQLTITDTPDRLQTIQDFIESLPQIRSRRRSKIIFIDHATASALVGQIESFLGVETDSSGASGGPEITKTMRVEDELEFNGAFFRVTRVNENDESDDNDDSVEMVVRTGDSTQDVTIEEFRSEFVEEFEIIVDDVKPSGTEGEGRARMTIRYDEDQADDFDDEIAEDEEDLEDIEEETGLTIVDIDNLNAIFVEYENVEDLREVEFWIRTLDIPTLQVSIEIKFVEVVTNKSKQWLPDFSISDLTEGVSVSDSVLRSRFAQDQDEFQNVFDPMVETGDAANLLKGATVFDWVLSNGNSPISFTLKMLEAQGVINVVNGPTVTVLNTETADFIVERQFGLEIPEEGSSGDDDNYINVASIEPVDLSVTPNVTRAGNITLDIDVTIDDFDTYLGQLVSLDPGNLSPVAPASTAPEAIATNNSNFGVLHKELTTQARISDGGTVVLGGWRSERTTDLESGIPVLQDIPFIGPLLFTRTQKDEDKITLLIFLTGQVVRD